MMMAGQVRATSVFFTHTKTSSGKMDMCDGMLYRSCSQPRLAQVLHSPGR